MARSSDRSSDDPRLALARSVCRSVESVMGSPNGFNLPMSPMQRAIARIIDGTPMGELATHPDVVAALGGADAVAAIPRSVTEVMVLAGVRTGKSMFAAATAVVASQTINIDELGPGEVPRIAIVSLTEDNALATFQHVSSTIEASPLLRLLIAKPITSGSIFLTNPQGRLVEIRVVCLNAAGGSLVSRWLLGAVFDEAPRCPPEGVKSLKDARSNVLGRLRDGGHIMTIGSPWGPTGTVPDAVREHFGLPTANLVVVCTTGPAMNSHWWTRERCEALRELDYQAYLTDVLGKFRDAAQALLSADEIDAVLRHGAAQDWRENQSYVAVMDPATRRNAWTLILMTRTSRGLQCAMWRQWQAEKGVALRPRVVLQDIANALAPYEVRDVLTDQWSSDALRDIGEDIGLNVIERTCSPARKFELFEALRLAIVGRTIELPNDRLVRQDLLNIRKRVTTSAVAIELLKTEDGRHADYAAALGLAFGEIIEEPRVQTIDEDEDYRPRLGQDRLDELYGLQGGQWNQ